MRALLDVNVIIALLDSGHVMHTAQPAYPNTQPAQQVADALAPSATTGLRSVPIPSIVIAT